MYKLVIQLIQRGVRTYKKRYMNGLNRFRNRKIQIRRCYIIIFIIRAHYTVYIYRYRLYICIDVEVLKLNVIFPRRLK